MADPWTNHFDGDQKSGNPPNWQGNGWPASSDDGEFNMPLRDGGGSAPRESSGSSHRRTPRRRSLGYEQPNERRQNEEQGNDRANDPGARRRPRRSSMGSSVDAFPDPSSQRRHEDGGGQGGNYGSEQPRRRHRRRNSLGGEAASNNRDGQRRPAQRQGDGFGPIVATSSTTYFRENIDRGRMVRQNSVGDMGQRSGNDFPGVGVDSQANQGSDAFNQAAATDSGWDQNASFEKPRRVRRSSLGGGTSTFPPQQQGGWDAWNSGESSVPSRPMNERQISLGGSNERRGKAATGTRLDDFMVSAPTFDNFNDSSRDARSVFTTPPVLFRDHSDNRSVFTSVSQAYKERPKARQRPDNDTVSMHERSTAHWDDPHTRAGHSRGHSPTRSSGYDRHRSKSPSSRRHRSRSPSSHGRVRRRGSATGAVEPTEERRRVSSHRSRSPSRRNRSDVPRRHRSSVERPTESESSNRKRSESLSRRPRRRGSMGGHDPAPAHNSRDSSPPGRHRRRGSMGASATEQDQNAAKPSRPRSRDATRRRRRNSLGAPAC